MKLYGTVCDKNGSPLAGALVEVKNENFQTLYKTECDESGKYSLELPEGKYPYLVAVRDYGEKFLEYWSRNINLTEDLNLEIKIDKLEIYALHAFIPYSALAVYFRPMSLTKYQKGEKDICPNISKIRALVDGKEVSVLQQNTVKEYVGEEPMPFMDAFLIQVALPENRKWNRLDIEIWDDENAYGAASIFA